MRISGKILTIFALSAQIAAFGSAAPAQTKPDAIAPASTCSRDSALGLIERQIDLSRTIDNDSKRIDLILRAADLLWLHEQDKARAGFTEAFDLASRLYKEKGDADTREGNLRVQGVDYRYRVITAIAKRDAAWGRRLSQQILDDDARDAAEKTKDTAESVRTAEKLLTAASNVLETNPAAALDFANRSLGYAASIQLPGFLYKLAATDRKLADQFYLQALNVYARAPMDQFLYLSSYPFAANREIGEMPTYSYYTVPAGITPNPALERAFVSAFLNRARELIQNPASSQPSRRFSESTQIFMGLSRLESTVATTLPDLSATLAEIKRNVASLLSEPEQKRADQTLEDPPKRSFDELIEAADKLANADRREQGLAMAILNASEPESLEKIEAAALKVDDIKLRSQLMNLIYFLRSQTALKDKKLSEARRLASKVDDPDQRAYMYAAIANDSLKQPSNETDVRELLEDLSDTVIKAPNSEMKARALLVVVHLYSTVDPNRAVSLLGEAVKTINAVESINLSTSFITKRIEGKSFGFYRGLSTPGFSPEVVFRDLGKIDFDGTLYVAASFSDKFIRGITSLAVAEQCLKDLPPPPKPKTNKPASAKPR